MSKESYFSQLPTWGKGAIAVGIFAVVVGGSIAMFYTVRAAIRKGKAVSGDKQEGKKTADELKESLKQDTLSYARSQYESMANQLKVAFDGYGTDNGVVESVFGKMKKKVDVLMLIDVYGIRKHSSGRFNPEPDYEGTLSGALANEGVIDIVNEILTENKVDFTF